MSEDDTIDRRAFIGALGLPGLIGLAGCSRVGEGGGSTGDTDMGPRVEAELNYWAAAAFETKIQQDTVDVIRENMEELGIKTTVQGRDVSTSVNVAYEDVREQLFSGTMWGHGPDPSRIDPDEFVRRQAIDYAGADGQANVANWANCEYSKYAIAQRNATSEAQRRKWVNEAQRIASEAVSTIPIASLLSFGAYRNSVDAASVGSIGIDNLNPMFFMDSTPRDGEALVSEYRPHLFEDLNPLTTGDIGGWVPFMRVLWSPLIAYNADLELEPVLARRLPEFSDGGRTLTVELREGLQFHNGDPLTALDVAFTYEFAKRHADAFPMGGGDPGFEAIEAVDDRTLEMTFPEPSLTVKTVWMTRWGILHEESLRNQGAVEAPADWRPGPGDIVGSGPMRITDFESAQTLAFGPTDVEHPVRNPEHTVVFQGFEDASAIARAVVAGDIDVAVNISGGNVKTIEEQGGDAIETTATPGHGPFLLYPETHVPPFKFAAVREAVGMAIDRETINGIAFNGENNMETRPTLFNKQHPWRAPDDMLYRLTDDLSGDVEAAKQTLEDAGFVYDDDGTLHYPPDADLDPLWPAGEEPTSDDGFDCLNSEGEFVGDLPSG